MSFANVGERAIQELNFSEFHGRKCRVMWATKESARVNDRKNTLFVSKLPLSVDNHKFLELFSQFAPVMTSKVHHTPLFSFMVSAWMWAVNACYLGDCCLSTLFLLTHTPEVYPFDLYYVFSNRLLV